MAEPSPVLTRFKSKSKSEQNLDYIPSKARRNTSDFQNDLHKIPQLRMTPNTHRKLLRKKLYGSKDRVFNSFTSNSFCYDKTSCIKIGEHISSGSYSHIYKGHRIKFKNCEDESDKIEDSTQTKEKEEIIALKILNSMSSVEIMERDLRSEIKMLKKFKNCREIATYISVISKNKVLDVINFSDCLGFAMKYYCNGDVYTYMLQKNELSLNQSLEWVSDICKGVSYLHHSDPVVLHRDIKTLNFLIDEDYSIKLADFGLSRFDTEKNRSGTLGDVRSSLMYAPPESFNTDNYRYDTSSDIYSLSLSIWEIISYHLRGNYVEPFKTSNPWQIPIMVSSGKRPSLEDIAICNDWNEILIQCWDEDPMKRPSINDLLEVIERNPNSF